MSESADELLRIAEVKKRYGGCSSMWVERRLANDPNFPRPIHIARRRFWRLGELVAWEQHLRGAA
jgi:predicted DNA-binding transcriptional regulator AlpA